MMELERWIIRVLAEVESREEVAQWEREEDEVEWRWSTRLEEREDEVEWHLSDRLEGGEDE